MFRRSAKTKAKYSASGNNYSPPCAPLHPLRLARSFLTPHPVHGTRGGFSDAAGQMVAEYDSSTQAATLSVTKYVTGDHLGSTRVVTGQSQAVVARYDYLPFGEEIPAGVNGRTGAGGMGYAADTTRQRFTGKERDDESGLDYFGARYYSSTQGRFTGVDPLLSSSQIENPQTWNRYSYVINNPLLYTDPTGMFVFGDNISPEQKDLIISAYNRAKNALKNLDPKSDSYKRLERSLNALGEPGKDNGVTVNVLNIKPNGRTSPIAGKTGNTKDHINVVRVNITIDTDLFTVQYAQTYVTETLSHEASHVADILDWKKSGGKIKDAPLIYRSEFTAFSTGTDFMIGDRSLVPIIYNIGKGKNREEVYTYKHGWTEADRATIDANIQKIISAPNGPYGISPDSKRTIVRRKQ